MFYIKELFAVEGIVLDNDYEIILDFKKDDNVTEVLGTLLDLQDGMEKYNKAITSSISSEILVSTVLLDIEKSSIKLILKDVVKKLPSDEAIERFIDKPQDVIKGYVKDALKLGRKKLIDVVSDTELTQLEKEDKLYDDTKEIIENSELSKYGAKVSKEKLLRAADAVYKPLRESKNDIYFAEPNSERKPMSKSFEVVMENTFKQNEHPNTFRASLIIKKPDIVGTSKWTLVLDKAMEVEIQDKEFIQKIKNREIPILAGDRLDCDFKSIIIHNDDYEVVEAKYYVLKVYDVVPPEEDDSLLN
jgi:hypothetical protein